MKLTKEELYAAKGGGFTAALGEVLINGISLLVDLGRQIGSAISYFVHGTRC